MNLSLRVYSLNKTSCALNDAPQQTANFYVLINAVRQTGRVIKIAMLWISFHSMRTILYRGVIITYKLIELRGLIYLPPLIDRSSSSRILSRPKHIKVYQSTLAFKVYRYFMPLARSVATLIFPLRVHVRNRSFTTQLQAVVEPLKIAIFIAGDPRA